MKENKYITVKSAADLAERGVEWVKHMAKKGLIETQMVDKKTVYLVTDVELLIAKRENN